MAIISRQLKIYLQKIEVTCVNFSSANQLNLCQLVQCVFHP